MFYRRKDPSRHFFTVTNALIVLKLQQDAVGAYIWAWLYYFYDR